MRTTKLLLGLLIIFIVGSKALTAEFQQVVSSGTTENLFGVCMTSDLRGYAVGSNGEVVVTDDGGNNWTHMPTGYFTTLRAITFVNSNTGYAVGLSGLVLKTTNAGSNWIGSVPVSTDLLAVCFADALTGYAVGSFSTAIKTTNGGLNWTVLTTNSIDDFYRSVVCTPAKVFIGLDGPTNLIASTNGGINWSDSKTRSGSPFTFGMTVAGNTIYIVGSENFGDSTVPIFFKSTDNGTTWFEPDLPGSAALKSVAVVPNYSHIITVIGRYVNDPINGNKGYIARSTDGGITWIVQPAYGTGTVSLNGITTTASNTFIIGNNGLILKGTNPIRITPISTEVPQNFNLGQNYPNPFNPTTNININVKEVGNVKIAVYDITGKEVAILVNEVMRPGIYKVDFNASKLTSGIYLYRMITSTFTETKKMVLVK